MAEKSSCCLAISIGETLGVRVHASTTATTDSFRAYTTLDTTRPTLSQLKSFQIR